MPDHTGINKKENGGRKEGKRRTGCVLFFSFFLFPFSFPMLCGCMTKDTIYSDIASSRARSYENWLGERQREPATEKVLRGPMTRDQCVNVALDNNKDIQAVTWDKEKAAGKITEAYSQAFPTVNLEAGFTRVDEAIIPGGKKQTYGVTATASQPLYRGGAIGAGISAARIYSYAADERIKEAVQNVAFAVNRGYYDVLLANELLRVSEQAVTLAKSHLDDVLKRREQGVASDYDVLRARVEVTNYEAEMIQNRNELHLLKTSFCKLLGVSQESDITFSDTFAYGAVEPELEDAVSRAFAERPELTQAELSLKLSEEALTAAKAERWPKADAFFSHTFSNPGPHETSDWGDGWSTGVTMRFPFFDGYRARGLVRQAKADLAKSRILLINAEESVLLEVKQALLSVEDARSFVESQKANVERAQQGLRLVEAGYREGVNTELEVRDARQALLRASALHYQAIHQHEVAVLSLKKATGSFEPGRTPAAKIESEDEDDGMKR